MVAQRTRGLRQEPGRRISRSRRAPTALFPSGPWQGFKRPDAQTAQELPRGRHRRAGDTSNTRGRVRKRIWFTWLGAVVVGLVTACSAVQPGPEGNTPVPRETPRPPQVNVTDGPVMTPTAAATRRPTEPASNLGVEELALNGVTIEFWHVWSRESGEALRDLVTEFNVTNPYGIRVETLNQESYADLSAALEAAIRLEDTPDVVVGFTNQIAAWDSSGGSIIDLKDYVDDPVWGYTAEEQADFHPVFWEQDVLGEKRLGLPAQRSAQFLFYNRSWARELGFNAAPTTIAEFQEQACAAAQFNRNDDNVDNDGTGGWVVNTNTTAVLSWIYAFGGQIEVPEGYRFNSDETIAALGYMKALFDEGCAWVARNRFPDPEFAQRLALFTASTVASLPFQERSFEEAQNEDDWTVIPFPTAAEEGVVAVFGPSFAVLQSEPAEQLASWLLIKWLLEPENQAQWVMASGHLPSRRSVHDHLDDYRERHPQWAVVDTLLPLSRSEPANASWGSVRWALSDAAEQIFRIGLTQEQIPGLLEELDETAAELHARAR